MLRFRFVSCFQWPGGPAQTSGGVVPDWRATAVREASRENDAPGTQASLVVPSSSSPVQMVCAGAAVVLTVAKAELPSAFWAKAMRSGEIHAMAEGEVLLFGVRFLAAPPAAGTTWISPPVRPASLIRPSMKATLLPSGETSGLATWRLGL